MALAWFLLARPVAAQPLGVRGSAAAATMLSGDQLGLLGYDEAGMLADVRLTYGALPWLDATLGLTGGAFLSSTRSAGGLAASVVGLLARLQAPSATPYALLDLGAGLTGTLVRPLLRAGVGLDVAVGHDLALGPTAGYGQVFQSDAGGNTGDARYLWIGVGLAYRPSGAPVQHHPRPRYFVIRERAPEPPPRELPPAEPSIEILQLIDEALPEASRTELLAPVLFRFDSDELEPVGTAMLHEMSRLLAERPELELLEIQGYADNRGSPEYNAALSERRARRVQAFLLERGVAAERLCIAPRGASDFVESGDSEQAHEQNRRVVLRVLRQRAP